MTITITTYDLAAGWTVSDFFDQLEQVYIDLGRHTAWHDRFTAGGYEHAILQHNYDNTKTYGQPYDQFFITGTTCYYSRGNSWNNTTNLPNGSQYLDYFGSTNNQSTSWSCGLFSFDTNTSAQLRLIKSGVNTQFGLIQFFNGSDESQRSCWFHTPLNSTFQPWIDFDVKTINTTYFPGIYSTTYYSYMSFFQNIGFRRSYETGIGLIGNSSSSHGENFYIPQYAYLAPGKQSGNSSNWNTEGDTTNIAVLNNNFFPSPYIILPSSNPTHDPNLTTDFIPIYTGLQYSAWIQEGLPSDIGIWPNHNGPVIGDGLVVSAGTNEWETLWSRTKSNANSAMASLVGRTL